MAVQENIKLKVETRTPGKGEARGLRLGLRVPAVVYSPKVGNLYCSLVLNEAEKYAKTEYENTIFALSSSDKSLDKLLVLRKDMARHPVSRFPIHFDFYAVDMKAEIRVHVELEFKGRPIGEKEGGVFTAVRRDVEIECFPDKIPHTIEVDISGLELDGNMHASDLVIPEGVKLITSADQTIATCAEPKEEPPAETSEAAAAAALAGEDDAAKKPGDAAKKSE